MRYAAFPLILHQPVAVAEMQFFGDLIHRAPRSLFRIQHALFKVKQGHVGFAYLAF
jgi:hypothetical protein